MDLPKNIKICNITYEVITKKLEDDFGLHDPKTQKITIDKGLSPEMRRNTFMHEVTHAILFQVGAFTEQKDEILVQSVANELDKLFEFKTLQ